MKFLVFDTVALMRLRSSGRTWQTDVSELGFRPVTTPSVMSELASTVSWAKDWLEVRAPGRMWQVEDLARLSRTLDPAAISVLALAAELGASAVIEDKATRTEASRMKISLVDLAQSAENLRADSSRV